jgi:ankyrin repeat protein
MDNKKYGTSIPWTVLQLAAGLGKQKSIDFFISKGASLEIKDKTGNTAEMISTLLKQNVKFSQ